ncbi:MAG TPA: PAS domain S-box protein [Trueperaceae bacterium]
MHRERPDDEHAPSLPGAASFEQASAGIETYAMFLLTPDNRIASWNEGVRKIFGYSQHEFVGQKGDIIFTPEERQEGAIQEELETAARTGQALDDRWQLRKDGSRVWVNGVMTALRGPKGELVGFAKIMRDNTALREAHEALQRANAELEQRVAERTAELTQAVERLQRSEGRFREIFQAGPFAASLNTAKEDRFVEVNEVFLRLTGSAREEVVGQTAKELGMWSSVEDRKRIERNRTAGGGFREVELQLHTKEGDVRTIVASGVVLGDSVEVLLKMFYDITERKRNEEELMRAIHDVMQDASWFSQAVVERLAQIRSADVDATGISELTPRERQVLERVARGLSNDAIAGELQISPQTVRNYLSAVYEKIGVRSRIGAALWARERGLGL